MKQRVQLFFTFFAILAICIISGAVMAAEAGLSRGAAYLESTQSPSGWWNPDEERRPVDTLEALLALFHAEGNPDAMGRAIGYLATLEADDNESLSIRLRALAHSTEDTTETARELTARQRPDGGWGLEGDRLGAVPDTVLAVLALLDSGKGSPNSLSSAGNFLLNAQHGDGAWRFTEERSLSDTVHTAMVLRALVALKGAGYIGGSQADAAFERAESFLESAGCLSGEGCLLDTAWGYLALAGLRQPSELQAALARISGAQESDGSWNGLPYDTAVCLRALSVVRPPDEPLPDLSVSETGMDFSPASPLSGESVRVSAVVFNTGAAVSPSCAVGFYDRDPRLGGVELAPPVELPPVPAGGSATVSVDFPTTGLAGRRQIVVFVDRQGSVAETSRANNAAAGILTIGGIPDLSVSVSEMTLSPVPSAFEATELSVTVRNLGNGEAKGIPVRIDDGERRLASQTLSSIAPGGSVRLVVSTSFSAGAHSILASVDPDRSLVLERELSNNSATLAFSVPQPPATPPDISVSALACEPSSPVSGEACAVTATVDNLGGTAAEAFDTVLRLDGLAAGTLSVPGLPAGGRAVLEFTGLVLPAGDHVLRAEADEAATVADDTDRANNSRETAVRAVGAESPAEVELVSLAAVPCASDAGTPVTFTAVVRNNGASPSPSAHLRFMIDGEAAADDLVLPALQGGCTAEAAFHHSFNARGVFSVSTEFVPDGSVPDAVPDNDRKELDYQVSGSTALSVASADLVLPPGPQPAFGEFTMSATVRNSGTLDAAGVPVRFLDNGREMATMTLGLVPAHGAARALLTAALPAGSHGITVSVDPDRILPDEHDYSDNSCTGTVTVLPAAAVPFALSADSLRLVPAAPAAGETVTLFASVANRGGADASASFTVELRDGEALLASFDVQQLPAGRTADFEVRTALAAGSHDISVTADPDGTSGDADLSDNSATLHVDVPDTATPPDLRVEAISASPSAPSAGDRAVFTVSVKNSGTEAAGPFDAALSLEGTDVASWRVSGLPGGGTAVLQTQPLEMRDAGCFNVVAAADSGGEVPEQDEGNNSLAYGLAVSDTPRPDLALPPDGVSLSPSRPQPGAAFTALVTVANQGAEPSPACRLEATAQDGRRFLGSADIPPLAAGASAPVSIRLALEAADSGFVLNADAGDAVAEGSEWNNSLSVPVSPVSLPDLLVEPQGISFSHTDLSRGTTVAVRVLVSNAGSAASPAGTVTVSRNTADASASIGSAPLPPLAPGGSCEAEVLWNAVPGSHAVIVSASLPEGVEEAEHGNNAASRQISLTGVLPAGIRLLDVPEDDSPGEPCETFGAYEDVEMEVTHHWGDACKPYIFVLDSSGGVYSVTRIGDKYYWNTGNAAPGDYRVRLTILSRETAVEVINGVATSVGILLEEKYHSFRIEESGTVRVLRLRANPSFAVSGENCVIEATAELLNRSNADRGLTATLRLKSPGGETLATRSADVAANRRDSRISADFAPLEWTSGAQGTYRLELEVSENGVAVAADALDFPVLGTDAGIRAVRRVEPEVISTAGPRRVRVTVEIEGVGNVNSGE